MKELIDEYQWVLEEFKKQFPHDNCILGYFDENNAVGIAASTTINGRKFRWGDILVSTYRDIDINNVVDKGDALRQLINKWISKKELYNKLMEKA